MSEIRVLNSLGDIDKDARLQVERSLIADGRIVIGGFGQVKTGFGNRLSVPLSEDQMSEDPGLFAELTFEQAMDLNARLATVLAEQTELLRKKTEGA